jgi:hypothetical protein
VQHGGQFGQRGRGEQDAWRPRFGDVDTERHIAIIAGRSADWHVD